MAENKRSLFLKILKLFPVAMVLMCLVVSFTSPVSAASLAKKRLTLYVGETYNLKTSKFPASAKWTSSKKSVASVSRGVVVAKKSGTTTIKAKTKKRSASCTVTVKPVTISDKKLTVSRFGITELSLTCGNPEKIKWSSSASSIAAVYGQNTGKVYIYGKKIGSAIVSASYLGRSYQCVVKVEESPDLEYLLTESDLTKKSPLYGKKIAVYGSSNEVGSFNSSKKSWVDLLAEKLSGTATVVNLSKGGNNVVNSVERIASDPNLSTYDIILVTTVRNTFRGNLPLPSDSNPLGFLESMYTLSGLIDHGRQTVYFASCLPMSYTFRSLSNTMSIYDGLVYKTCRKLGFKYLDMHNWLGISDEESAKYTKDGFHFLPSVHPILADHCLTALERGGETLRSYQVKVKGDTLYKALALQNDLVELDKSYDSYNYYSVDTELNVSFFLWLQAKKDIENGAKILGSMNGVNFYPAYSCLYGNSQWGACRMYTDGSVVKENGAQQGTSFVVQVNSRSLLDAGI